MVSHVHYCKTFISTSYFSRAKYAEHVTTNGNLIKIPQNRP